MLGAKAPEMRTRHRGGWVVLGLLATAGCSGTVVQNGSGESTGGLGGMGGASAVSGTGAAGSTVSASSTTGGGPPVGCLPHAPSSHRAEATTCSPSALQGACTTDSDCVKPGLVEPGTCTGGQCDYDKCMTDSDCASSGDAVCSCQGQTFFYAHMSYGNVCIPGDCATDADCATGFCSPAVSSTCGTFYGTQAFYCHACDDTCVDDSDCDKPSYCDYAPAVGHWTCESGICAG
jgi:hypothetical protein